MVVQECVSGTEEEVVSYSDIDGDSEVKSSSLKYSDIVSSVVRNSNLDYSDIVASVVRSSELDYSDADNSNVTGSKLAYTDVEEGSTVVCSFLKY